MKVKCIRTYLPMLDVRLVEISEGSIYEVTEELEDVYRIIADSGRAISYDKNLFEIVKEPKFKIGDKVVMSDGYKWTSDPEFRVIKGYKDGNYSINSAYCWKENELELYKGVEEMKTFEEIILNSEVGQIWEGETYIIKINANAKVIQRKDEKDLVGNTVVLWDDAKFELQRNKYTFAEAFESFEEGGKIESCASGFKYSKQSCNTMFSSSEIRGTWYINN